MPRYNFYNIIPQRHSHTATATTVTTEIQKHCMRVLPLNWYEVLVMVLQAEYNRMKI